MGVFRAEQPEYDVVLGPCPGCELWQVDYTQQAAFSYGLGLTFRGVLERVIREHLQECVHLQGLLGPEETARYLEAL